MIVQEGKYYKTRDGRKVGPAYSADRKYGGQDAFEVDGPHASVHLADGTYAGPNCPDLDLIAEWTDGPVRTVTRTVEEKQVVDGQYGVLHIKQFDNTCFLLSFDGETWVRMDKSGSGAAAAVLLELAGALTDG